MYLLTQVLRRLCESCKGFVQKRPKTLAPEQSYFAWNALACKAFRFVPYIL